MNLRPLGYEPNELPDCSTPQRYGSASGCTRQTFDEAPETPGELNVPELTSPAKAMRHLISSTETIARLRRPTIGRAREDFDIGCRNCGTYSSLLAHYGFTPTIVEKAPTLRTGGYMIDFWGAGFETAERIGLLPKIRRKGYIVQELRVVDQRENSWPVSPSMHFSGNRRPLCKPSARGTRRIDLGYNRRQN